MSTMTDGKSFAATGRPAPLWEQWLNAKYFVAACLILGLILRLGISLLLPLDQMSDSLWYLHRAMEIAHGQGYQEGGFPTAYWPVGWPAILAGAIWLVKSPAVAIVGLNLLAAAATMVLIWWFGGRILLDEAAGRLGLLAYALYPNHIAYTGVASTEPVYTALALAAFYVLVRGRSRVGWIVLSGLLFGVATLIKPQTYAFPLGAVIALLLVYPDYSWRSAARAAVIIYLVLSATVLPWTYRNAQVLGAPVFVSTNGGTALLLGANDQMTGSDFDYEKTEVFGQVGIPWEQHVSRQVELDRKERNIALHWIAANPVRYLSWMPRKVMLLWRKDTDGFWSFDASYPAWHWVVRAAQIGNQGYYLLVLLLSIPCAFVAARAIIKRGAPLMPLGLLFCMPVFVSLVAAVFTGQIRYHYPAMPYLFLAASWTLIGVLRSRAA